jgi:hypothetical protein
MLRMVTVCLSETSLLAHHYMENYNVDLQRRVNTVEPGYNDIGLCDTSDISSDILW